jgi:ABC-type glycerol-3-phosphate transport system substrate-binding protein
VLKYVNYMAQHNMMLSELRPGGVPIHDGWIYLPISDQAASWGVLANLGPMLKTSIHAAQAMSDAFPVYRNLLSNYGGKQIGIPLAGDMLLMYYRKDLFERYDLAPPQTWDDMLGLAMRMNGTDTDGDGRPDLWGACFGALSGKSQCLFLVYSGILVYLA